MDYGWQTVEGTVPSKSNNYKVVVRDGKHCISKSETLREYEDWFYWKAAAYRNLNIKGLFEYHCKVYYPSKRSDLDNSLKVQLDCLQYCKAITNDNNCVKIVAEKFIDKDNPRVEFKIITI